MWKTSKITITSLETVESYLKYNIHSRLAISTNSDYIVETPWYTRGVNSVNHFLPEKCVTRHSIFSWRWRSSHQTSAKERNFPFSCLCKIYVIAINGILAFCSYVIIDSRTPVFGYYSSNTYIHAIWIQSFKKVFRIHRKQTGVTWKKLIVNIFSWFLYQMKKLKIYSLPRLIKQCRKTHKLRKKDSNLRIPIQFPYKLRNLYR